MGGGNPLSFGKSSKGKLTFRFSAKRF